MQDLITQTNALMAAIQAEIAQRTTAKLPVSYLTVALGHTRGVLENLERNLQADAQRVIDQIDPAPAPAATSTP